MKKRLLIGLMMAGFSQLAMAYGYGYRYYGPDPVDMMAEREIADINAQERAEVMHEMREGDFREAQEIINQDEALKNQIRRDEARYDLARDRERFYFDEGYDGW